MIFIGYPEHTSFYWTILDACRGSRASSTAVGGDGQNAWPLLARRFPVALRHWPMLVYDVEHFV